MPRLPGFAEYQIENDERLHELLDEHGRALFAMLKRLTLSSAAEDLLQDLFVRLGKSEGFTSAKDPPAYAFRVAINLAMDWRRQRRRASQHLADQRHRPAQFPDEPLITLIQQEQEDHMLDALMQVAEPRRSALILRYLQEQSYEQVAASIGKTPHQARSLVQKGLAELRELLCDTHRVQKGASDV